MEMAKSATAYAPDVTQPYSTRIVIHGKPIAKKRPMFVRRGKFVQTINQQETEEGRWLWEATPQLPDEIMHGPVKMFCIFSFERPKSHYGTGRNSGKLKPSAPDHHIQKPDADNLLKWVKDCLNGQAYRDDSQITNVGAIKRWSNKGMTEIWMEGA
jgi:Holliday junction resolvase RusA-like endonuclease